MLYFIRMTGQNFLLEEEKEFKRFYKFSLWWVEHRELLRKIGYGIFISFDSAILLFVLWTMFDSFVVSYGSETRAVAEMVAYGQPDLRSYTIAESAVAISQDDVRVFPIGNSRYDFYAEIVNPNKDWWVEFKYQFLFDAGETTPETGFMLPGQEKPLISLAVTSQTSVQTASLQISDIKWHRIDHHTISDYPTWKEDRLRFEIKDAVFSKEAGTTFTVLNDTAFSYFDPVFYVVLKRGAAVVGVSRATVASINAGESQEVSLQWFGTLPSVSSVEVIPDINIFDLDSYKQL